MEGEHLCKNSGGNGKIIRTEKYPADDHSQKQIKMQEYFCNKWKLSFIKFQQSLNNNEKSVPESPDNKGPACSVPEAGDRKNDKKISQRNDLCFS